MLYNQSDIKLRLRQYPLFDQFSAEKLEELLTLSEIQQASPGTILTQKGEAANFIYYVIDGCVEIFLSDDTQKRLYVARFGEMIGEVSMLAEEKYLTTARVHRQTLLLKIKKQVFLDFIKHDPQLLLQLTHTIAKRLNLFTSRLESTYYPYKNIILYSSDPSIDLKKFKHHLKECIYQDDAHVYDKKDFLESQLDIVPFLSMCEKNGGVNIFLSESNDDLWDKAIYLYGDYLYLITKSEHPIPLSTDILEKINGRPCDVVLWHEQPPPYHNTQAVYESYTFKRHHHFRDEKQDYQRLFRFMTGQAIGLSISAGGFRGYAHYGLIKALFESKIPIDCIAGCSIGSAIGATLAMNFNWEKFQAMYEKTLGAIKNNKFFHLTLPVTSLLSGKLPTNMLKQMFNNTKIENMPINFFCITSNISTKKKEIQYFGETWEWIRASISIPGIFPPLEKNGAIYVDGAACTSVPVQDLRAYLDNAGKVISFDVCGTETLGGKNKYSFPPILTLKDMLLHKLKLSRKHYHLPSIINILLESSSIEEHMHDREWAKKADIIIKPDTSGLSCLNPHSGDPLSLASYTLAKEILKEHEQMYARWILE